MKTTVTFDPSLYVVVPREMTDEMWDAAADRVHTKDYLNGMWEAALSAAPPLPESQPVQPCFNSLGEMMLWAAENGNVTLSEAETRRLMEKAFQRQREGASPNEADELHSRLSAFSIYDVPQELKGLHKLASDAIMALRRAAPPLPEQPQGEPPERDRNQPETVERLADAFLGWPLPKSVCSDTCVSNPHYAWPRTGTNLLTADEAKEMVKFLLGKLRSPPAGDPAVRPATVQDGPAHWRGAAPTAKDSSSIRAAGDHAAVPAVRASVDLRNRALAYLALAEKATPGPWYCDWPQQRFAGNGESGVYSEHYLDRQEPLATQRRGCVVGAHPNADEQFIAASHEAAAIIRELLNEAKP